LGTGRKGQVTISIGPEASAPVPSNEPESGLPRAILWRRRWEYCRRYYQELDAKYQPELDYATKQDHWSKTSSGPPKSKTDDLYRGREVARKVVRMTADVMNAPRTIMALPVNTMDSDPKGAEQAKFGVEHVMRSPLYGFDTYFERAVISAAAARRGSLKIEWDGRINDFVLRNVDPRRLFLAPGWTDPWDRTLPYAIEQIPMSVMDARVRFNDPTITADLNGSDLEWPVRGMDQPDPENRDPQANAEDEGSVLVLECWSLFDATASSQRVSARNLTPLEQYSYCPTCGYSMQAGDVSGTGQLCPHCLAEPGTAVEMVTAMSESYNRDLPNHGGRRLEYILPLSSRSVGDGPWPERVVNGKLQQLRAIPHLMLRRFEHPTDACGVSETTLDAPLQSLSNQLMERIRQQAQGPGKLVATTGYPKNFGDDEPWSPTDAATQFIRFGDPIAAEAVNVIDLGQVSPALFQTVREVQTQLRSDLGTFEMTANSAEDLKGVPVATSELAAQSGAVPTDHFRKIVNRQLGPWAGVVLDMIRIYWTEQRWVRLQGPFGVLSHALLSGEDFPEADFVLTLDPEKKLRDAKQVQAVQAWWMTGLPPQGSPMLRRALANLYDIPQSIVDDIDAAEQQAAEQQRMAMLMGGPAMPGDAMGMGGPGGPAIPPGDAGPPAGEGAPPNLAAIMAQRGMA